MKQPKQVLWISHFAPYPAKGGAFQRAYNMIKGVSNEFDIHLITLINPSTVRGHYASLSNGIAEIKHELSTLVSCSEFILSGDENRAKEKVKTSLKSLFSFRRTYDELFYCTKEFSQKVNTLLASKKFDLIYVDTGCLTKLVMKSNVPIIVNHHNIESEMLKRRAENSGIFMKAVFYYEAWKMARLEKLVLKKARVNLVCSSLDASRLQGAKNYKIEVVPNGVDIDYFKRKTPYSPDRQTGLVFAGGLTWYPNADAMKWFADEIYPVIKGTGYFQGAKIIGRGKVEELDRLSQHSKEVDVLGYVDDVRPYIEGSAIYICPIRDGGGTKLKVLDALAMGCPLVAHPLACEGIDVIDKKHVLMASTPQEFANCVQQIIQDADLSTHLSRNGIELIKDLYSYSVISEKFKEILLNSLNKKEIV